jgi:hypothetical protein
MTHEAPTAEYGLLPEARVLLDQPLQHIADRSRQHIAPAPQMAITPMAMLSQAVSSGASIEVLEKLMALQERWEANNARKAYGAAIAEAKREFEVVHKNATGHNNKKYADFAAIAKAVDPVLGKHGLSYRFRTVQNDRINVTCVLSHRDGHSEDHTLSGPPDASGSKNAIQAIGSTLTYLQRYTLVQALGIAVGQDDDGRAAGHEEDSGPITADQAVQINKWLEEKGKDKRRFCELFKIEAIVELPASRFQQAKDKILGVK